MEQERIRRRHLPHWDVPGASYFVTACLEGSIPAQGLLDLEQFSGALSRRPKPETMSEVAWTVHKWKMRFVRQEKWLDHDPRNRLLERPELAQKVVDSMFHFAGERYGLLAFVVMPSHFHWLFRPRPEWVEALNVARRSPRERIMYSLKRYTANQCNRILGTGGRFWQQESYDHWPRDVDEMERIIHYIENNPVTAKLVTRPEDWQFSSARIRKLAGVELGVTLTKDLLQPCRLGFQS